MRRASIIIALCCLVASSVAQTVDEKKKNINNIKKSHNYVYAEVTTTSQQEALDLATEMLHQKVNEYVATQKKFKGAGQIVTVNTNYAIENITMPRADMYRAFIYVRKADIIPANNAVIDNKPATLGNASASGVSSIQEIEEPVGRIAVGEGVAEIIEEHDPVTKEVSDALLKCETTAQMQKCLSQLKASGKIISYNKLSQLQNAEECMMAVFDTGGKIKAILSEGAERKNMRTQQADALNNYKGCGAIGIKVNK